MMQLCSEMLLSNEIKNTDNRNEMWIALCKKELAILKKLKLEGIDLTGTNKEFVNRLNDQSLYLMSKEEYESLVRKAEAYERIKNFILVLE